MSPEIEIGFDIFSKKVDQGNWWTTETMEHELIGVNLRP